MNLFSAVLYAIAAAANLLAVILNPNWLSLALFILCAWMMVNRFNLYRDERDSR